MNEQLKETLEGIIDDEFMNSDEKAYLLLRRIEDYVDASDVNGFDVYKSALTLIFDKR